MSCAALVAPSLGRATTKLPRAIRYQDAAASEWNLLVEHSPVRLSRVGVTDRDGHRQPQMQWAASADPR